MKKSVKSVTENSVWLTELTDAEMESTTGGVLTNDQLNTWLDAYKNGTLQTISVLAKLQKEYRAGDGIADVGVVGLWFVGLTQDDKRTVVGAVANTVVSLAKSYLSIS